jgi:hypothetical protein
MQATFFRVAFGCQRSTSPIDVYDRTGGLCSFRFAAEIYHFISRIRCSNFATAMIVGLNSAGAVS